MKQHLKIAPGLARTLVARGLAQEVDGYLVPVVSGADPAADSPFPSIPEDLAALSVEELTELEASTAEAIEQVTSAPLEFVNEAIPVAELLALAEGAVEDLEDIRAELAARETPEDDPDEPDDPAEPTAEEAAALEAIAALGARTEPEPVVAEVTPPEPVVEAEPVVAAATPARRMPRPARSVAATPVVETQQELVALVAGAGAPEMPLGAEFPDMDSVARAMIERRRHFGVMPDGVDGSTEVIARASWAHLYGDDRTLSRDEIENGKLVDAVVDPAQILSAFEKRRRGAENGDKAAMVASGGLCAPVTPYYQLQMVSTSNRPVRAALPSFNADRGGIRYATPPSLGSVVGGTAVGGITAAQDAFPGSSAQKTCLTLPCPPFLEVDVTAIFHCIQTGNLGARTYPERIAHYNNLVLAAQARFAESLLLTAMDVASTQVTAGNLGLGASATLFSQWLAAANAMRNRHRMDANAVLRLFVPEWVTDLIVSDVIRGQFQRFDTNADKVTALLRQFYIEPTYYLDGAAGRAQVFGTQGAGALLPFPATVVSYLFPEGAFLHLDSGTLELGLVRDSVLNKTNDFQIFGETFENLAFIGVESIALASSTCDMGIVAGTHNTICPLNYGLAS